MKRNILLVFLFIFIYFKPFSQIVNIEKRRKNVNGIQLTTGLDFNIKNNGKQIIEIKNTADIQYKHNAHTFIFLNDLKLLDIDNGSFVNSGFQHLRYNYNVKDSSFLTLEAFGQHQYNEQKLLTKRILAGGGPRFAIARKKNFSFYAAPLAMYEHEQLSDSFNTESNVIRLDAYTNIHFKINELVYLGYIMYYQPRFTDMSDYRLSSEASLNFTVTKHLGYKAVFAFDYDNRPPENIPNTFWYFNNKLILKL
ncbi:MAG: DUF481 domain-containing protein [Chlorobi bacterium]|nr:DUF481 domain-containing protein [Chlorobiota bacterium]